MGRSRGTRVTIIISVVSGHKIGQQRVGSFTEICAQLTPGRAFAGGLIGPFDDAPQAFIVAKQNQLALTAHPAGTLCLAARVFDSELIGLYQGDAVDVPDSG